MEKIIWLPFFLAGGLMLPVGLRALLRREVSGAYTLAVICFCSAFWSFCEGLLYFGFDQSVNILITKAQYLGLVWTAPLMLIFSFSLFDQRSWSSGRVYLVWLSVPAAILALAWTNEYHWLIWSEFWTITGGQIPMLGLKHGPAFWVYVAYAYLCLGIATVSLFRWCISSASIFRSQALIVFGALGVVWLGNIIYLAGWSPIPNVDTTPLTFSLASGVMAFGFFRYRLLDVVPVAKAEVFNSMLDGVLVMDREDRIIDFNPAAEKILNLPRNDIVGRTVAAVFQDQPEIIAMIGGRDLDREVSLGRAEYRLTYDLRVSTLRGRRSRRLGRLLVWRDITRRKDLEEKLRQLATTDELTGIFNRRSFLEQGRTLFALARRHQRPLSVLVLDLDKFKNVNDTHGHHVGDMVLRHFADLVSKNQRVEDVFGRLGGEEFALVLGETEKDTALKTAERLRRIVAETPLETNLGPVSITVSIGVAAYREQDMDLGEIMRRADKALYRAKAQGRNQVMPAEDRPAVSAHPS